MREVVLLATTQFGLFTRAQAHERGVSDRMLQRRVRAGLLERLDASVFRIVGAGSTWHQDVLAACLGGGERCVASHRTAAALHEFDDSRKGLIEVTVPRTVRYRRTGIIVHQSLDLSACDVTNVAGIPVTTAERTLIDLGAVTGFERVEHAFDGAERDAVATRAIVVARHAAIRRQGRNGVGPMAVVLDRRPLVVPHSVLERAFMRLVDTAGMPPPACQHPVRLANGRMAYIDAAYVELVLGFELDGHRTHATRAQRAADNRREHMLRDAGWDIRRFTYEQVMDDGASVARAVKAARAQAVRRFGDNP